MEDRAEIISSYSDLFEHTRSGTMPLVPLMNGNLSAAIDLAYFGMKSFEELRGSAEFTYEEVVRSIRYTPAGNA